MSEISDLASWYGKERAGDNNPLLIVGKYSRYSIQIIIPMQADIGESPEFTTEAQEEIARVAKSMLLKTKENTEGRAQSPPQIVYGLHFDNRRLRILAHFKNHAQSGSGWAYCQAIIAQHLITMDPSIRLPPHATHCEDQTFLDRWRIARSIFTIRQEVNQAKKGFWCYQPWTRTRNESHSRLEA